MCTAVADGYSLCFCGKLIKHFTVTITVFWLCVSFRWTLPEPQRILNQLWFITDWRWQHSRFKKKVFCCLFSAQLSVTVFSIANHSWSILLPVFQNLSYSLHYHHASRPWQILTSNINQITKTVHTCFKINLLNHESGNTVT